MANKKEDWLARYWQPMIDHLNQTWKAAAKKEFNYPFTGKDMADIRIQARNFNEWGIMALWDIYIEEANEYVQKRGFDIFTFTRSIPSLLGSPHFKNRSRQYEAILCGDLPAPLKECLKTAFSRKLTPKPSKQALLLRHWAKVRRLSQTEGLLPGFS